MILWLYGSIWISLVLFVTGEIGKRAMTKTQPARPWAWWAWSGGLAMCALHVALAMGMVHRWSHESALQATARQTTAVYGIDWGGGVYVNYLFVAVWAAEAVWWRARPLSYARQDRRLRLALRAFYFVVISNAAIVFASGLRWLLGAALVAVLLWAWRKG